MNRPNGSKCGVKTRDLELSRLLFHKWFRHLHFDEGVVSEGRMLIVENIPELIRDT